MVQMVVRQVSNSLTYFHRFLSRASSVCVLRTVGSHSKVYPVLGHGTMATLAFKRFLPVNAHFN